MIINVKDTGAVADGITLNTRAFQKAIDQCYENGGGTVLVPPGNYYTGKIILKDNITLHLSAGAQLIASSDTDNDYVVTGHYEGSIYTYLEKNGIPSGDCRKEGTAVIYACSAKNIRITGQGVLEGNYTNILVRNDFTEDTRHRWANYTKDVPIIYSIDRTVKYFRRPVMVFLEDCHNVILEDFTVQNASMYTCNLRGCSNVTIRNITVNNYIGADNADGFHFSSCEDVKISDCVLRCGDDCIAIDSNDLKPSRRFSVTNCSFNSRNNCFRIFTSLNPDKERRKAIKGGLVSDIVINNCTVEDASSFVFIHGDEGCIERVTITNAAGVIHRLGTVFLIAAHSGIVRNVTMSNWAFESNGVGYIYSNRDHSIYDIRMSNMNILVKPSTKLFGNGFDMPTEEEMCPEEGTSKPIYYLSHYAPYFLQISRAEDVTLSDVTIRWGEADIDDIHEVGEYYEKYAWIYLPPIWGCEPHWPAIYTVNSKNIRYHNVECEAFGDDAAILEK